MPDSLSNRPVRIGLIGAGQISGIHQAAYAKIPDAQMVAIADINESAARAAAEAHQIPNVYTDFREMLLRDDIDAVDVCLHNNFHRPATEAALEAGKHVYCEKPMAGSYHDAAAMMKAAQRAGLKLSIQLSSLFLDATRAARELIDSGLLGDIFHARSTGFRRRGRPFVDGYGTPTFVQKKNSAGGALYDMGVYHIAQMLYLMGNPEVVRITGKTYQKTDIDPARERESGYDVEELGLGFVRFKGDQTLDIIESWAIHLDSFEGSSIVGSKGGIRLNPFGFYSSQGDLNMDSTVDLGAARFRWDRVRGDGPYYGSAQGHWIAALQGKVKLLPTAEIALNTMLISEGIYLSDKEGRDVTPEEVRESSKSTAIGI